MDLTMKYILSILDLHVHMYYMLERNIHFGLKLF